MHILLGGSLVNSSLLRIHGFCVITWSCSKPCGPLEWTATDTSKSIEILCPKGGQTTCGDPPYLPSWRDPDLGEPATKWFDNNVKATFWKKNKICMQLTLIIMDKNFKIVYIFWSHYDTIQYNSTFVWITDTMKVQHNKSDFEFTKRYLNIMGQLWGVYLESCNDFF